MSLPDQHVHVINQIDASLCSLERRQLYYLCGNLNADDHGSCVKEMLRSKVKGHENGNQFLAELLVQLGRYDILKKVFRTDRDEVERTLQNSTKHLSGFRVLMAKISEDMASEDLRNVKFLLSSMLPHEKMDNAKNFLDIISELEKLDRVSPESVDLIEDCLRNIGRVDLAKKVNKYKTSAFAVTSEHPSCPQQRCRVNFPCFTQNGSPQQASRGPPLYIAAGSPQRPGYRQRNYQSPMERYKFNTDPRGVCVIIDCVGSDGDMLKQTFQTLHFNVILHELLSVGDTLSALQEIFRQREHHGGDGFACCIVSRGTAGNLLATDPYGTGLRLDAVRQLFRADACPPLAGRPKLFFIQRYSTPDFRPCPRAEHRDEDLETDGCEAPSGYDSIPTDADVFWSHCWTDERQLQRGQHRSVYLRALTDALHKGQRRKMHLVDAHIEVNAAIYEHNRRNPGEEYHIDLKHTLRKELYLQ